MTLDIASPCRGICKIDEPSQLCSGCLRDIDEITRWRRMGDDEKLAVLSACLDRQILPGATPAETAHPTAGINTTSANKQTRDDL